MNDFHTGYDKLVELLLNHGANINSKDFAERTPLYLAATEGHLNVVKLLLEKGTAIESAERDTIVKELTEKNNDINKQDTKTEEELARVKGSFEIQLQTFVIQVFRDVLHSGFSFISVYRSGVDYSIT